TVASCRRRPGRGDYGGFIRSTPYGRIRRRCDSIAVVGLRAHATDSMLLHLARGLRAAKGRSPMQTLERSRLKWPYATHLVDRNQARSLLPMRNGHEPGALVLARVGALGKHRDLEGDHGRKMSIFTGDVFVGVLGDRYATDQFEALGRVTGPFGHIVGIGGV